MSKPWHEDPEFMRVARAKWPRLLSVATGQVRLVDDAVVERDCAILHDYHIGYRAALDDREGDR